MNDLKNKTIVVTRITEDNKTFKEKLENLGASVYEFPAIRIRGNTKDKIVTNAVRNIFKYDWVIFTSAKGVTFFMEVYAALGIDKQVLNKKKIAVVGSRTAERLKQYEMHVDFIPTKYTTEQLAQEITDIKNKHVLIARADIGNKEFISTLTAKGAHVTDIPIYQTEYITQSDEQFEEMVKDKRVDYLTFTSPSTVRGFLGRIKKEEVKKAVLKIPVISIGPVTTKSAQKYGFHHVFTADSYTITGIITKLEKINRETH